MKKPRRRRKLTAIQRDEAFRAGFASPPPYIEDRITDLEAQVADLEKRLESMAEALHDLIEERKP